MNQKIDYSKFDFLDLGCKTGGSIDYCAKRYRQSRFNTLNGLGIDINHENVQKAKKAGYQVIEQDILKLKLNHKFQFVSALDFLEHLPGISSAEQIIAKMTTLATDFLFIRHPSFEDIEYLASMDLKITWSDWRGHTALLRSYDYANIFNKLGYKQYCFVFKRPIWDSSSKFIIPLSAPIDTHEYTKDLGKKKHIKFAKPIYSQIDIFVALKPIEFDRWNWIAREDK